MADSANAGFELLLQTNATLFSAQTIMPQEIRPLRFDLVERVTQALRGAGAAAFADLVMILPQDDGGSPIAIYNRPSPPALEGWKTRGLDEIDDGTILAHKGLVIAWSALDVIFPSLVPYGPDFYNIRWLFNAWGQVDLGLETAYRLSRAILKRCDAGRVPEARQHAAQIRILQFGLPHLLKQRTRSDLLGVYVPRPRAIHDSPDALQYVYLRDIKKRSRDAQDGEGFHPDKGSWIVALSEIAMLLPHIDPDHPRFLDLRPIMQAARWEQDLQQVIYQLSSYAWKRWEETGDKQWLRTAYALAAEYRFTQEEITTLVALRPDNEFGRFRKTGRAYRYTRAPIIFQGDVEADAGETRLVVALSHEKSPPKGFHRVIISLPILKEDAGVGEDRWIDLRPILLRSGRKYELARVLWLFARDLLPPLPHEEWENLKAAGKLDAAMDMLLLSYHFYNLIDPWQWREGRYPVFARWNYQAVVASLESIERRELDQGDDTAHYTRGLRAWYGVAGIERVRISEQIAMMVEHFKQFLGSAECKKHANRMAVAQAFTDLGNYLLDPTSAKLPPQLQEQGRDMPGLYRHLYRLIEARAFYDHLSPLFLRALQRYHPLRQRWMTLKERLDEGILPVRAELRALEEAYNALARTTYALRHEMAILDWLYERDREQVHNLLEALSAGPIIQVQVLNPWVIRGRMEELTVKVVNSGSDTAHHFLLRLRLRDRSEVDFIQAVNPLPMEDLNVGEERFWRWRIRTRAETLTLNLRYQYRDFQGVLYREDLSITIPVRGRRAHLPAIIANPYRAGTPVYGADLFYGREAILRQIFSRLLPGNTQPILLRGPRRMGKTSILRQIQWLMEKRERLEKIGFDRDQLSTIQRHLLVSASLQEVDPGQPGYIRAFFEGILRDVREQARIHEPLGRYRHALENNPVRAFRSILGAWIEIYIQAPVIILLDEWDEVYREEYRALARNLRSLIESRQLEHVNWVISSTWVLAREVTQFGSPFYNQTLTLEVGPLGWNAARKLVTTPSDRINVDWQGEAVVALLEQTGRRPYLIQLACSKALDVLANDAKERKEGLITVDILHRTVGRIIQDAQSSDQYFGFLWQKDVAPSPGEETVNWMGRLILWALMRRYPRPIARVDIIETIQSRFRAEGLRPPPPDFFEANFKTQMLLLHRIFDAITEQGGRYTIAIPLMQNWLRDRLQSFGDEETLLQLMHRGLWEDYEVWRQVESAGEGES